MKELSIEEKAKAYDEAKLRMSAAYNSNRCTIGFMNEIFPELKESEDERIRKEIIIYLKQRVEMSSSIPAAIGYWIDWLEKQGKQDILEDAVIDSNEDGLIADTIKQSKQKAVLIPKFKVGDIITNDIIIGKVDENENNKYHGWFGYDKDLSVHCADIPDVENWHKWTIQDAKDGDVLVNDIGSIFIYKNYINNIVLRDYCHLATPGYILTENDNEGGYIHITNVYPATKEQRDKLEKAMDDAGYTFDFERKELKKIEQNPTNNIEPIFNVGDKIQYLKGCGTIMTIEKIENGEYIFANSMGHTTIESGNKWHLVDIIEQNSAWSKEDEKTFEHIIAKATLHFSSINYLDEEEINFLKSLKDRVQPQSKQEWNEEDRIMLSKLEWMFTEISKGSDSFYGNKVQPIINWLKSLHPQKQWKPSEEQIEALESATANCAYSEYQDCLRELIGQLKKL